MLSVTINANYQRKLSELHKVNTELMIATQNLNSVTEKVDDVVAAAGSKSNLQNNQNYQKLVAIQFTYDMRKDNLESQAKLLQSQCESMKKALSSENKATQIWCFG